MKKTKAIYKQLTVRLPVDVHRALKVRVAEQGGNMGGLAAELIRQWLAKEKRA